MMVLEWLLSRGWRGGHAVRVAWPQKVGIGQTCCASSMGPRWVGCLTAPQLWMSGNGNGNQLAMGGKAQNRKVCAREWTLGPPRGRVWWEGHRTRPEGGGGVGGGVREGGGGGRWGVDGGGGEAQVVVMTQKRQMHVRNIEKSIKFDEK